MIQKFYIYLNYTSMFNILACLMWIKGYGDGTPPYLLKDKGYLIITWIMHNIKKKEHTILELL
jgi:hypothetical protein